MACSRAARSPRSDAHKRCVRRVGHSSGGAFAQKSLRPGGVSLERHCNHKRVVRRSADLGKKGSAARLALYRWVVRYSVEPCTCHVLLGSTHDNCWGSNSLRPQRQHDGQGYLGRCRTANSKVQSVLDSFLNKSWFFFVFLFCLFRLLFRASSSLFSLFVLHVQTCVLHKCSRGTQPSRPYPQQQSTSHSNNDKLVHDNDQKVLASGGKKTRAPAGADDSLNTNHERGKQKKCWHRTRQPSTPVGITTGGFTTAHGSSRSHATRNSWRWLGRSWWEVRRSFVEASKRQWIASTRTSIFESTIASWTAALRRSPST